LQRVTVYEPDFLFAEGKLQAGARLCVDDDGRVAASGQGAAVRLKGRALFPGLVNAHSHAFQRVLRGHTERVEQGDDFWAWRERMYRAASTLTPEQLYVASRQAFVEMALAGITTVGEFHYLHHQPDGRPYDDVHELARQVVRAARDAGLRIALLRVAYARAGFQVPSNPRQARFIDPDVETYLQRALELKFDDPLATVGLAPHSVRAVPRPWLEAIARAAPDRITHLHVAEQPAEVKACFAEHGLHPVDLLDDIGLLHARTTAVHGIHLDGSHAKKLARVCACPTTEANLGDGIVPADILAAEGTHLCLGTDSQARIDLLEEARLLDGHLRLQRLKRAVLEPEHVGAQLLRIATEEGAAALGLDVGRLAPGQPADFFTVDLTHPTVVGVPLESLVFAATPGAVRDVAVQGRLIVREGQHALAAPSSEKFAALVNALAA
jgi:formimidoylglutamate deiminase